MTKYQRFNFIIQIHQFTIKIDKININLLFECVKIVEFDFNSLVFHVMYQETRFLNQDACFLNQEGRRQLLISFCFRGGLKPKNLPCSMDCSTKNPAHSRPAALDMEEESKNLSEESFEQHQELTHLEHISSVSTPDEELRRRFKNEIYRLDQKESGTGSRRSACEISPQARRTIN